MSTQRGLSAGLAALTALLGVTAAACAALLATAVAQQDASGTLQAYIWRVLRFTLLQATLSALISVLPALFVARALARRPDFPGRGLLLKLFALPLALPAIVAVLGIVEVWGQQGFVNRLLLLAGNQTPLNIYGLSGILIAHLFFNLPLATRMFLGALERVPGESWRLAAQLGFSSKAIWRLIEWPILRAQLPAVTALVFMLCLTSFTTVLTLGGGPRATTIEVAIYQALRFDFDPVLAVRLALLQLGLTGTLLIAGFRLIRQVNVEAGLNRQIVRFDGRSIMARGSDGALIALALLATFPVFASILVSGVRAPFAALMTDDAVWRAAGMSLTIASGAAFLSLLIAWPLVELAATGRQPEAKPVIRWLGRFSEIAGSLVLVMPPIVLGAGWFVLLLGVPGGRDLGLLVVIVINALMAVPFVSRILSPAIAENRERHDRLCMSLGLAGAARLRLVDWPVLRRPLGTAIAFALALSLGDLGAIALFGSEDLITLPLLLLQRLGNYRVNDAAGLALLLGALCLTIMALAENGARRETGL